MDDLEKLENSHKKQIESLTKLDIKIIKGWNDNRWFGFHQGDWIGYLPTIEEYLNES